ncbi:MAG: hypothetical protein IPH80_23780 [Myxococcales bacterium]|nr:hypothetical protein [Myxococcales bacterium]
MSSRACVLVCLGLAACDSPNSPIADAGAGDAPRVDAAALDDAPVDAPSSDAALATVTVHVRSQAGDGAPDPTATVFFVAPDGSLTGQAQPDASGVVVGAVEVGGSVTVGWDGVVLVTMLAVEDGDDLVFGPGDVALDQPVAVTLPALSGASSYAVGGPCLRGTAGVPTVAATFGRGCGLTHSLLATSRTAAGLAYLIAPAVTPTAGVPLAVTGAWVAGTTATVDFVGVPPNAGRATLRRRLLVGGAPAHQATLLNVAVAGGAAQGAFPAPAGYGDTAALEVTLGTSVFDRDQLIALRPTLTEAAPVDVTPTLPEVTTPSQAGATVTWTTDGAGTPDAVVVDFQEVDALENVVAAWRVIAPPDTTAVTLPTLPAPFDVAGLPLDHLAVIDTSAIASYAGFRAQAGAGVWIDALPLPAPPDARWFTRSR